MSRPLVPFFFVGTFALLSACSGTKSAQQTMAEDRAYMYKEAYSAYIAAENKYLNLLFNIERMPEEEELWIMKRDQMRELEQLREFYFPSEPIQFGSCGFDENCYEMLAMENFSIEEIEAAQRDAMWQ